MPLLKLRSLTVDVAAERDGQWVPINEWAGLNPEAPWEVTKTPGLGFHVRSINDPSYKVARQQWLEEVEQLRQQAPNGIVSPDVIEAGEGRLLSEKILLGWRGLDETYSSALAATLLPTPDARPIREMIIFCASKVGKRKVEFIKDAEKN